MIYKKASQLHNEDEVRHKKTGAVLRILQAYPELHPVTKKKALHSNWGCRDTQSILAPYP